MKHRNAEFWEMLAWLLPIELHLMEAKHIGFSNNKPLIIALRAKTIRGVVTVYVSATVATFPRLLVRASAITCSVLDVDGNILKHIETTTYGAKREEAVLKTIRFWHAQVERFDTDEEAGK